MNDRQRCVEILAAEDATILALKGEIDICAATEFKEALLGSIAGGSRRIVVDAAKVTFMDSSGLSVLIAGEQRLRALGGSLAVVASHNVERLLKVAGLRDFLALYPSRDEALRAASGAPSSGVAALAADAL